MHHTDYHGILSMSTLHVQECPTACNDPAELASKEALRKLNRSVELPQEISPTVPNTERRVSFSFSEAYPLAATDTGMDPLPVQERFLICYAGLL